MQLYLYCNQHDGGGGGGSMGALEYVDAGVDELLTAPRHNIYSSLRLCNSRHQQQNSTAVHTFSVDNQVYGSIAIAAKVLAMFCI